jgi:hypothetical protein
VAAVDDGGAASTIQMSSEAGTVPSRISFGAADVPTQGPAASCYARVMERGAKSGDALRAQLDAVGLAKAAAEAEDHSEHLRLPIEARLQRTLELSDAVITMFPDLLSDGPDDEAAVWARVQAHLAVWRP